MLYTVIFIQSEVSTSLFSALAALIAKSAIIPITHIKKIIFYNYEVKMADASVSELSKTWWMSDTVEQLSSGNYLLNLEVDPENGVNRCYSIEFEFIDVEKL